LVRLNGLFVRFCRTHALANRPRARRGAGARRAGGSGSACLWARAAGAAMRAAGAPRARTLLARFQRQRGARRGADVARAEARPGQAGGRVEDAQAEPAAPPKPRRPVPYFPLTLYLHPVHATPCIPSRSQRAQARSAAEVRIRQRPDGTPLQLGRDTAQARDTTWSQGRLAQNRRGGTRARRAAR